MAKTILVVEDEKDIIEMLRYNLQKEGYHVVVAEDGKRALEMSLKLPELILLDVMLPELDGWEVARRLRHDNKTNHIPIVFLTARTSEMDEVVGLELGADDYIVKPISLPKLMARIRALFRRKEAPAEPAEKDVIHIGEIEINRLNYTVRIGSREVMFPKKEFEILAYLAQHRNQVVTREMLLNAVWGDDVYVIDRTVDVHISKVREKLGRLGDWIETVKGVGYRIKGK